MGVKVTTAATLTPPRRKGGRAGLKPPLWDTGEHIRLLHAPFSPDDIRSIHEYQSGGRFVGIEHHRQKAVPKPHGLECPQCGMIFEYGYGYFE